jgi:glycosyltransferase involved in cell wall biosynthesis
LSKKVLYIYFGNIDEPSGVRTKLTGLLSAFAEKKIDWTLFSFSENCSAPGFTSKNYYTLPLSCLSDLSKSYFELDRFLKTNHDHDISFFRYPLADDQLIKFLEKYPNKFIFEHNTKEVPEIRVRAGAWVRKYKFRVGPSYFKLLLNSFCKPILRERQLGRKVLKLAKGGVAVTDEICRYEKSRYKNYNCRVISNGIDVKNIDFYKRDFKKGEVLNVIMLCTSPDSWHGDDLVLESFLRAKRSNVRLYLIGRFSDKLGSAGLMNENVIYTGFLGANDFKNYLKIAHIGMGAFALYRKHLEEAATLKVREYFASGLPVCLGHTDVDVQRSKILTENVLQFDTRKEPVNWDKIYDWAAGIYSDENRNQKIRDEAFLKLDISVKAAELLSL